MEYLEAIIQNFRDGTLDVPNGTTLRGHIATELRCLVKRISKKMEGTNYNGRQSYERKLFDEVQMEKKKNELFAIKQRFEKSVEELRLQEQARFPGNRGVAARPAQPAPAPPALAQAPLLEALGGTAGVSGLFAESLLGGLAGLQTSTNNELLLARMLAVQRLQRLQTAQRLETLLALNALQQITAAPAAPPAAPPASQPELVDEQANAGIESLLVATQLQQQASSSTDSSGRDTLTRLHELISGSGATTGTAPQEPPAKRLRLD